MNRNFFQELEEILESPTPKQKIDTFALFYEAFKKGELSFEDGFEPKAFVEPSYATICTVVPPQDVPKRKNLTTVDGQIILLHAVAHIEYSAIDLALDAAYRFAGMPVQYYEDWLGVADDEVRHFLMLEKLLKELGSCYGEVEVHNALFEASQRTQSFIERMAVVPRYLEANGLDATPMILEKLHKLPKSTMLQKIIATLELILEEEVDHVKRGDDWFEYACKKEGVSKDVYFDIIKKYYPQGFLRPKNINIQARKDAGFSCAELNHMSHKSLC